MNDLWVASLIVLWLLVLLLAFLLAGALRQLGIIHLRMGDDPGPLITDEGLDRGVEAPEFQGIDAATGLPMLSSELRQRARVLVFLSTTCGTCREIVPHVNESYETRRSEFDFLVICRGTLDECQRFARMNNLKPDMLVDENGVIEADYKVTVTPFSYFLDYEGHVLMRGIANDWTHFEALLNQEGTEERGRSWTTVSDGTSGS